MLLTPEWKKKRLRILDRDNCKCRGCSNTKNLEVHHIHYIQGNKPWQVPDKYLITLCSKCHSKEHKGKNIQSFVLKKDRKKKKKKQVNTMTKRDRALQERYNKLKKENKL